MVFVILFVSTLVVIWLVSYIDLLSMTKKKRTAAQFFDDAETYGLELLMKTDLNDEKVSKGLESGTETNYTRMLVLWDE